MKVLILAAGHGTRLYPLVIDTPKALLKVHGKPLANYILERIAKLEELTGVIVVTNNKFYHLFQDWAQGLAFPFDVQIVNDGTNNPEERLGSMGDIDFIFKHCSIDEDFLVVGGDNLFDFRIDEYILFAQEKSPSVTVGLYDIGGVENARQFGVVELDQGNRIISFEEKPRFPKSSLIAMCFYYFPKESQVLISQYLLETESSDTSGDYIRWLCRKNDVYGFKFKGKWYDIGSVESYKEAQEKFNSN